MDKIYIYLDVEYGTALPARFVTPVLPVLTQG